MFICFYPLCCCTKKLALRAGNEKEEGETADTVGCCSLRVEHITLHEQLDGSECVVEFDFLGKDSIRYYNKVPVIRKVKERKKSTKTLPHTRSFLPYCIFSDQGKSVHSQKDTKKLNIGLAVRWKTNTFHHHNNRLALCPGFWQKLLQKR